MSIDPNKFREDLSDNFIKLLDSKRGVASNLAKAIGKPPGFINEVRRGKPVNAFHIKAVSIVFGQQQVLDLLGIEDVQDSAEITFRDKAMGRNLNRQLVELEAMNHKVFEMVATYITGAYEAAKATSDRWDGIEKRNKENRRKAKEAMGFENQKNGTDE